MAPGYGYNMNMTGNPWMMLAQQGLGMLSGSSMGYGVGNFGGLTGMGMGCGNSVFTNCYGEPNYEAMAGFAAINAALNVGSTAAMHAIADGRASKINSRAEIKSIDTKIIDKQTEINKLNLEISKYDSDAKISKLVNEDATVKSKQSAYDDLKAKHESANTSTINPATGIKYTQADIDALGVKVTEAYHALEAAKAEAKSKIEAERDALKEKLATAQGELEKLEEQRDNQYHELSEKDKAKYCQTRFVTCERNETKAETEQEKKEAQKERYLEAKRLVTLYNSSDKAKKEIPEIMYNAAKQYIDSHPEFKTT